MTVQSQSCGLAYPSFAVAPARASALEVFLLSALAKAGATIVTYPMLTIKTRLYTAKKGDKEMQYAGIVDAATQILRREGEAPVWVFTKYVGRHPYGCLEAHSRPALE